MQAGSTIDYDALTQDALRSVVRNVLTDVAKNGLPGEHHFYVAFETQAAGVVLSKRLREKYPEEMMIVLQHRFWDLAVNEDRFEVKLTFDGIPERLVIPFTALKVFFDPSARVTLQFDDNAMADDVTDEKPRRRRPRKEPKLVADSDSRQDNGVPATSPGAAGQDDRKILATPADGDNAENDDETSRQPAKPGPRPLQLVPRAEPATLPTPQVGSSPAAEATSTDDDTDENVAENTPVEDDRSESDEPAEVEDETGAAEPAETGDSDSGGGGEKVVSIDAWRKKK